MARKPVPQDEPLFSNDENEDWQNSIIEATPDDSKIKELAAIAAQFGNFRPAREVLRQVRAVPTIFSQFDFATRVKGLPLERFIVVHGPSSMGKTTFCAGLAASFIRRNHFCNWIDAEMTTPHTWLDSLFSRFNLSTNTPLFNALRPNSYEEAVSSVRQFLTVITKAKKAKKLPPETSGIVIVDSLRKLVPENILEKIKKEQGGVDGMGGRGAQIKAAMNAAWLDELIPALHASGCTMVVIARESENTEKKGFFDRSWKMTGGKAIEFDSSLIARITRDNYIKQGSGENAQVIGEKHEIAIRKTKVAGKDDKQTVCFFHTSNGRSSSEGFDTNRDILELGLQFDIVKKADPWLLYDSKRIKGVNGFIQYMETNPDFANKLDLEVRNAFDEQEPLTIPDTTEEG